MANTIAKILGDSQKALPGTACPVALVCQITNGGVGVSGITVTFAIASYPGGATGQSLNVTTAVTDNGGIAQCNLSLGNVAGTYTVTATAAGVAGSPVTFSEVASSQRYTLFSALSASGTVKIYLVSPETGLTLPTPQTVMLSQDLTERIDAAAGVQEVAQIDLDIVEDYTTYAEGFWMHVLANASTDIQITLDEGSGETDFFFGRVQPGATTLHEVDLTSSAIRRTGTIHLMSFLTLMQSVPTQTVINAVLASTPPYFIPGHMDGGATSAHFVMAMDLIAQAISFAIGQTFASSDVSCPADDIKLSHDGGTYYGFAAFCFAYADFNTNGSAIWTAYPLFWDFMESLCGGFGLAPRWYYDPAAGRHKVILLTRGRSYGSPVSLVVPEQSDLIQGTPQLVNYIQVTSGFSGGEYYYNVAEGVGADTAPAGWTADMSLTIDFGNNESGSYEKSLIAYALVSGDVWSMIKVEYWNYATSAFVSFDSGVLMTRQDHALAAYLGGRLGGIKRVYEQTFRDLRANDGSTNTHANISLMRNVDINDGVATRHFYVSEIRKNIMTRTMKLRLQEV